MENPKSISEAISALNGVIKESSQEIKTMISKDIQEVKESLSEIKPEIQKSLHAVGDASGKAAAYVKDKIIDSAQDAMKELDGKVHACPWCFIGGASVLMGVFGFLLGRKAN